MAEFTKGEWGKAQLEKDLRNILRELVQRIIEIRERQVQPEFNKGLDAICDYDEAIEKILKRTAAPEMHRTIIEFMTAIEHWQYTLIVNDDEARLLAERDIRIAYNSAKPILAKAEGRQECQKQ